MILEDLMYYIKFYATSSHFSGDKEKYHNMLDGLKQNSSITSLNLKNYSECDMYGRIISHINLNVIDDIIYVSKFITELKLKRDGLVNFRDYYNGYYYNIYDRLCENTTITSLDFSDNYIRSIKGFRETLKENSTITYLNLSNNCIQSLNTFFKGLSYNSTLTELDLSHNEISRIKISKDYILKNNSSLTSLNLSYNEINDGDLFYIAEYLKHNSSLSYLNLEGNSITDEGKEFLINALKDNTTLTKLII